MSPCPFCGASGDRLTELWERIDEDLWAAKVHCTACGCMGPSESAESAGDALRTAGEKWERRYRAAPVKTTVDAQHKRETAL